MLILLTLFFIAAQLGFFIIHYKVHDLIDTLVNVSILSSLLYPVVLMPIIGFIAMQIMAYVLFVAWIGFVSVSLGEFFQLSKLATYWLGILCWFLACIAMLTWNHYYFPDSFFAKWINNIDVLKNISHLILIVTSLIILTATLIAYLNFFWYKRYRWIGGFFLLLGFSYAAFSIYDIKQTAAHVLPEVGQSSSSTPDVILIGLDSLRPDFTGYFGNHTIHTPHIDDFLRTAAAFNQAYTPLGRTFPAWVSILTAQYPKHHFGRNNLVDPVRVLSHDTIAKRLQLAGYETIYATDEKRFSNITTDYGFDRVIGPSMGVNDFILGGLSDFPMSNLLLKLRISPFLFPYNYANRAAAITYGPDDFLRLVKLGLRHRSNKPLFFAIHLCLSHWPFTWARDGQDENFILPKQYKSSVEAVDDQLGKLMQILQQNGLLQNSLVVLLSDHGTAVGLPGDRFIDKKNYLGDAKYLDYIPVTRLSSAPLYSADYKHDYTINTSYGQGNNVLSLKQYRILLAFKQYGGSIPAREIGVVSSLVDIAPTILDMLKLPPLQRGDGISLRDELLDQKMGKSLPRALFLESGDSLTEIETDHIYIEKVLKHEIGIYRINPTNGLLMMDPKAEQSIIKNKQLAVLWGDWLLARYPALVLTKFKIVKKPDSTTQFIPQSYVSPSYFLLANLKSGQWTVGLSSSLAKTAPVEGLMRKLKDFYGDEV